MHFVATAVEGDQGCGGSVFAIQRSVPVAFQGQQQAEDRLQVISNVLHSFGVECSML